MTREEAIERLKTDIYKYADFTENPNENEFWMAFDMSIKALEQEPVLDKIREIVDEWQSDTWTDNLSYDCMIKIAELVEPQERSE